MKFQVCIAGWYFYESFYKVVEKLPLENFFIVSHRAHPYLLTTPIRNIIIENVGLEFGIYDWFIKNQWDHQSKVIFIHDDTDIREDTFEKISTLSEGIDVGAVFKDLKHENRNLGWHGRLLFISPRMIKRFLDQGGMWYDSSNTGNNLDKKICNLGIRCFRKDVARLKNHYKELVARHVYIDDIGYYKRGEYDRGTDSKCDIKKT